jgi:hypothetical protein
MSVPDERRKLSRQNEPLGIGAKPERDRYGGPDRRRVGNRRRRSRRPYARDFAERRSWFETKRAFLEGRRARRPAAMNIYLVCIFWPAGARWALRLLLDVRLKRDSLNSHAYHARADSFAASVRSEIDPAQCSPILLAYCEEREKRSGNSRCRSGRRRYERVSKAHA